MTSLASFVHESQQQQLHTDQEQTPAYSIGSKGAESEAGETLSLVEQADSGDVSPAVFLFSVFEAKPAL